MEENEDMYMYKQIFKSNYNKDSLNYETLSTNAKVKLLYLKIKIKLTKSLITIVVKDFIMKFLVTDPKKRLTAYQALRINWIQGKATKNEHLSTSLDSMRVLVNKSKTQVKQ